MAKLIVVEGPLLTRMKNANLLSYKWVESTSGPPRKYYSLTSEGRDFLQELHATWNELIESVLHITSNSDSHEQNS
jgi:PadR family transcriptional regulator, regulatory protein PadR